MTFLNKIKNINYGILELSDTIMTKTLLFGDSLLSDSTNTLILNSAIDYVIAPKDLMTPLLLNHKAKKHYLAIEKKIICFSLLFFKISLYSYLTYLTPFTFFQIK